MSNTLVFDGDCGFCTTCVGWLRRIGLAPSVVVPWQQADLVALGLTAEQCQDKVQWVSGSGAISSGHEAFARVLLAGRPLWRPLGLVLLMPPASWLAARLYDVIAANRSRLPGGTPACAVPPVTRPADDPLAS